MLWRSHLSEWFVLIDDSSSSSVPRARSTQRNSWGVSLQHISYLWIKISPKIYRIYPQGAKLYSAVQCYYMLCIPAAGHKSPRAGWRHVFMKQRKTHKSSINLFWWLNSSLRFGSLHLGCRCVCVHHVQTPCQLFNVRGNTWLCRSASLTDFPYAES